MMHYPICIKSLIFTGNRGQNLLRKTDDIYVFDTNHTCASSACTSSVMESVFSSMKYSDSVSQQKMSN